MRTRKRFGMLVSISITRSLFRLFNTGLTCGTTQTNGAELSAMGGGATPNIGKPFGLIQGEILELVRVALNGKQSFTSEAVSASLRELHRTDPLVKMVISYADADYQHVGTIYQATNWIYLGKMNEGSRGAFVINGKKVHPRTIGSAGGKQSIKWIRENLDANATEFYTEGKHRYVFCFDKKLRKRMLKSAMPYPKK